MNIHQENAQKRLDRIAYNEARIKRKLEDPEYPPSKREGLLKRLDEYADSRECLELTLKTGALVRLKNPEQMALVKGVVIDVPAGNISVEGGNNGG